MNEMMFGITNKSYYNTKHNYEKLSYCIQIVPLLSLDYKNIKESYYMKYKFTKDDTFAIKGIAIIFLLCIHCIAKDRIEGLDVSYWPLSESAASWLITVMSECVGIFEFLSVYGMTLSVKNKYPQFEYTRTEALADALRRY